MTKKKPSSAASRESSTDSPAARGGKSKDQVSSEALPGQSLMSAAGIREVIESIVIAFVLAFLFRTFEAEAFVIPTGSMAPTLMGRHKDVVCDQCGYSFQVSASDEVDNRSNQLNGNEVISATCPMCRHTMYLGPNDKGDSNYPSYKGDRILVGKFPYEFGEPKRWDVVVFKYPEEARTNFIKRLVGLPGETLRITHGDVFLVGADGKTTIVRKPPHKILAMMQPVYDTQYVAPQIVQGGWPARWIASPATSWKTTDFKSYQAEGHAAGEVWLQYQHRLPSYDDWKRTLTEAPTSLNIKPQLISDFSAYNTEGTLNGPDNAPFFGDRNQWLNQAFTTATDRGAVLTGPPPLGYQMGLHWVGDLVLEANVEVENAQGELILELVKGGRHFQCRVELANGKATLRISGLEGFQPTAQTAVQGPGSYRLMLANVDQQLVLWVNGRAVSFEGPGIVAGSEGGAVAYQLPDPNWQPQLDDLEPARIGARGAKLKVDRLRIYRDLYYIAVGGQGEYYGGPLSDFDSSNSPFRNYPPVREADVAQAFSDPSRWEAFGRSRAADFPLKADQFFMLGDNSAESKDSRLWGNNERFVSRELLIGKALVIYWPHSLDSIPGTKFPFPFFPNFSRMGLVR
jgi:signal peptidase I